jgi:hypothetical protein
LTIQGISTVTRIEGVGTVRWTFKDVFGTIKIIETRAYYIPGAGVRLFLPQVCFQGKQAGSYLMTSTITVLTTAHGCALTIGYQLGSNLPMVPSPPVCTLSRVDHSRVNLSFEYETILSKHAWEEVKREKLINAVPSTWAFKCKRYPDGRFRKLKAQLCVRGDSQVEGVYYFDTYVPVVT